MHWEARLKSCSDNDRHRPTDSREFGSRDLDGRRVRVVEVQPRPQKAVLEFAFDDLGTERVWAGAAEWNTASARVLRRLGMRRKATNPEGYRIEGELVATEEFEIWRDSWLRVAGSPSG